MTEIGSADHSEIDADHPRSAPRGLALRYQPTMTYQPPQPQQTPTYVHPGPAEFPPTSIPPTKPPRSKVPTVLLVILLIVALVLVVGLIGAVLSNDDAAKPKAAATTTAAAAPTTEAAAAEPVAPDPANFTATPRIVSKKCFGSAGCNVSLRIDLAATVTPETGVSWLIVYEIHGVKDGPQVGNLTVTGDDVSGTEERVTTESSKSKITVKVVSVEVA